MPDDSALGPRTDRHKRQSMAPISRSAWQLSCDIHLGDIARLKQLLFGKPKIEETAVVGKQLNIFVTEDVR